MKDTDFEREMFNHQKNNSINFSTIKQTLKMNETPFKIGDLVRDKCTGFAGRVVGVAVYEYEPSQCYVRRTIQDVNGLHEVKWFTCDSLELEVKQTATLPTT